MDSNANVAASTSSLPNYFVGRHIFRIIWRMNREIRVENECTETTNFGFLHSGTSIFRRPLYPDQSICISHSMKSNLSGHDGIADFAKSYGSKSISDITTEAATVSISNKSDFLAGAQGESMVRQGFLSLMHMMQNENEVERMIKFNSFISLYKAHDRSICFEADD